MVGKKAQMKIQQMIFMLVGLTLFFVLVGLFVFSFMFSGIKEQREQLDEQNAILLVSKLANSPEFSCGEAFGGSKTNCVDFDKVMVLKDRISTYSRFWGVEGIEILKLSPEEGNFECNSENYPNCEFLEIIPNSGKGIDKSSFVNLCRKEKFGISFYNKCELAKLIVRVSDEE